jgi:hypothetical protein
MEGPEGKRNVPEGDRKVPDGERRVQKVEGSVSEWNDPVGDGRFRNMNKVQY